jgi:DNA polymerase-3 subunit delta'
VIDPIVNAYSQKLLSSVIAKMPQSLLLTGENGVGLSTVAKYIAEKRGVEPTIILPEKDEKIDLIGGIISVDIMRRLYNMTSAKNESDRIIIIDYAERMTTQAQNAFLKLLEEPGSNIYFILVSNSTTKLLPTVISRAERLEIRSITSEQSSQLLDKLGVTDTKKRAQLMFMADGLPAELTRLAGDDEYFNCTSEVVRDARELLTGKVYQRLLIAQKYKDNRPGTVILLTYATKILKKSLSDNPTPDNITVIDKIIQAHQRVQANGNIRLSLASLAV